LDSVKSILSHSTRWIFLRAFWIWCTKVRTCCAFTFSRADLPKIGFFRVSIPSEGQLKLQMPDDWLHQQVIHRSSLIDVDSFNRVWNHLRAGWMYPEKARGYSHQFFVALELLQPPTEGGLWAELYHRFKVKPLPAYSSSISLFTTNDQAISLANHSIAMSLDQTSILEDGDAKKISLSKIGDLAFCVMDSADNLSHVRAELKYRPSTSASAANAPEVTHAIRDAASAMGEELLNFFYKANQDPRINICLAILTFEPTPPVRAQNRWRTLQSTLLPWVRNERQ
jgi:hypothetical protein